MSSDLTSRRRRLTRAVDEAKALFAMFRNVVLVLAVLAAGTVGGYAGGILAALNFSQAREASHSAGMPGIEAIYVKNQAGTFEELGRAIDQFNAQLGENWEVWESLARYVLTQGWTEIRRTWAGPTARPTPSNEI